MKELAILRFVKGLAGSLPLVGDFITNVRSKHPATGDIDYIRLTGTILSYAGQFYALYLVAKGIIEVEDLKQIGKALK